MIKSNLTLYILLPFCLIFGFLALQQMSQNKKLQIGDQIPSFTLQDQNGEDFLIDKFVARGRGFR